jgi:hypothetical protein
MDPTLNVIEKPKKGRPPKHKTAKKSPTKLIDEEFMKLDNLQVRQKKPSVKIYDVLPEYSTKVSAFMKGDATTCWELVDINGNCKTMFLPSKCLNSEQTKVLVARAKAYTAETEEKLALIRAQQVTTGKVWAADTFLGLERIASDPGNDSQAADQDTEKSRKRTLDQVTISDLDEPCTKRSKTGDDEVPTMSKQSVTSEKSVTQATQETEAPEQDCKVIQNPNKQEIPWEDDLNKTMRANFTTTEVGIVEHHKRIHKGTLLFLV